jgi:hypothetical protein
MLHANRRELGEGVAVRGQRPAEVALSLARRCL